MLGKHSSEAHESAEAANRVFISVYDVSETFSFWPPTNSSMWETEAALI